MVRAALRAEVGDEAGARADAARVSLAEQAAPAVALAAGVYHAALGRPDRAAEVLAGALRRAPWLRESLRLGSEFDRLRGVPAFDALLAAP
jgi:hypothetical protein